MEPTRSTLIVRVGDPTDNSAWSEFAALYQPLLFAYLRSMGLRDQDAQELVQELMIKLLTTVRQYDRSKARFRTWLYRVVHNHRVSWLRRAGRDRNLQQQYFFEQAPAGEPPAPEPDEAWELAYRQRVIQFALQRVREELAAKDQGQRQWRCFEQYTLSGRKAKDVARELGIANENNVRVYSLRVLERLRATCLEYDAELSEVAIA